MSIKLRNAALDERTDGYGKKQLVLRGTLMPETLRAIRIDSYQRKEHTPRTLSSIMQGFLAGNPFLDIALGMRGENFRDIGDSDDVELLDPTFAIDGYHRVVGAILTMESSPETPINLGAQVFFNTTFPTERDWFRVWNTTSKNVSPSVILRNERDRSRLAATLYGLSMTDQDFALYQRVAWDDRPVKKDNVDQLVRGMTLLKVTNILHMHKFGRLSPGSGTNALCMLERVESKIEKIGLPQLRGNLKTFFAALENCWPFVKLPKNASKSQTREAFLLMLARLFSDHEVFWRQPDEKELVVSGRIANDLRRLDLNDPEIAGLLHRGRHGTDILYSTIVNRLNKGRTTHRLVDRWQTSRIEDEEAA
jgi:hypothetical protein